MRALVLVVMVLALLGGCGGDDEPAAPVDATCETVQEPEARKPETLEQPTETLDPTKTYTLVFETSCGSFSVKLDLGLAPKATASLVSLARQGFYDDTIFHRIVPGFVIQGGDPTQQGSGGPGYTTLDAPPPSAAYTKGTVAMAKAGFEPAGAAGSQFFVITAADAALAPEYAIVGEISEGLGVVESIGRLGDVNEQPRQPVLVRTVTVTES